MCDFIISILYGCQCVNDASVVAEADWFGRDSFHICIQ